MEISEGTIGIYYIGKALALAPFSIRKNSKGVLEIRRSIFFTFYSISLILLMVILTYRGLLFDANSKIPVRTFRMTSATSKVVTALDVSVVVLATSTGVFCGTLGFRSIRELNMRLKKIDDTLHPFTNSKMDRLRAIFIAVVPVTSIIILLFLDIWTWLRIAENKKTIDEDTEENIYWYFPFYGLYLILTGFHVVFANTAFGLGRRYCRLNSMLKSQFLTDGNKKNNGANQKITTVRTLSQIASGLSNFNSSITKLKPDNTQNEAYTKNKGIIIKLIAESHESLDKCVNLTSDTYGITVLFILVSCLLHLVATAYFLFLEMLDTKDNGYVWLQILWIIFHACRLLLVVEPCHLATLESKKTIQIVCEIERKLHDPILIEETKKFWQQLLIGNSEFSASGLCKVNRQILTSFSSAIATYLVILIQFQKTNG